MRFTGIISFGTERYPEKIARRLRATNITAYIGCFVAGFFAVWRFIQGVIHWKYAALVAVALGLSPFLHRFGHLVAPLTLTAISYTWAFWLTYNGGVANGTSYLYFMAGALAILLLGAENVFLSGSVGATAIALHIFLHLHAPQSSIVSPSSPMTFVVNVLFSSSIMYVIVVYAVRQLTQAEERAENERARSDNLLTNILPPSVAERLKERPKVAIADAYSEASILFADMAGFTARVSELSPTELIQFLNDVYTRLDGIVERHGLEKIKTTGDSYMVVSGVPEPVPEHAAKLADLALDMRQALSGLSDPRGNAAPMRIGIASGPVVAGVVGSRKFFYDVWGDAVNMASRMESTGVPGKIQVAPEMREFLAGIFKFEERGIVEIRGKGPIKTWFLVGRIR